MLDFCAAATTATVAKQDRFVVNSFKRVAIYLNDHVHLVASNAPGEGVRGGEKGKNLLLQEGKVTHAMHFHTQPIQGVELL